MIQEQEKILIEYLYEKDKLVSYIDYTKLGPEARINIIKGKKIGVVVAIGASIMGWSLCRKGDTFNKVEGIRFAKERARFISYVDSNKLEEFYANEVPYSLNELILKMNNRSIKYFK